MWIHRIIAHSQNYFSPPQMSADSQNHCRLTELLQTHRIIADSQNYCRLTESLQTHRTIADSQNYCRLPELLHTSRIIVNSQNYCRLTESLQTPRIIAFSQIYCRLPGALSSPSRGWISCSCSLTSFQGCPAQLFLGGSAVPRNAPALLSVHPHPSSFLRTILFLLMESWFRTSMPKGEG